MVNEEQEKKWEILEKFKKLQKENEKIRKEMDKLIGINNPLYNPIFEQVNLLIENEIEQEKWCNQ